MPKQAVQRQSLLSQLSPQVIARLREGIFIIMAAVALFLLLSLLTYHRTDPGWSHTGASAHIANAGGQIGAWFADLLFYLLGFPAYLLPVMLVYGTWFFLKHPLEESYDYFLWGLRFFGFFLIFAAGTGLTELELINAGDMPFTSGGVIGHLVGVGLVKLLNLQGTSLLLLSLLLIGITMFTDLSWLKVIEFLGFCTLAIAEYFSEFSQKFFRLPLLNSKRKGTSRRRRSSDADTEDEDEDEESDDDEETPHVNMKFVKESEDDDDSEPAERGGLFKRSFFKKGKNSLPDPDDEDEEDNDGGRTRRKTKRSYSSLPSLELLDIPKKTTTPGYSSAALETMSHEVEQRLLDFGVEVQVVAVHPGPVITRFELQLAPGIKVSKISGLSKDLARSLSVTSVRIVDVIPGKSVIGLEVPNEQRETVRLREVLASDEYEQAKSPFSMALGKDIAGEPVIVDLSKMPHLLVAGTTGSGKSVGLNVMLLSILYKSTPSEVRMLLIDPKMLELSVYEGIPHLLAPVVTDMKEAANALRWCVAEMERRYRLMAALGVRNIAGFNARVQEAIDRGESLLDPIWQATGEESEQPELEPLPYILVLVDEFADMMMVVGKKVEELIARIAQKARAAGIHLILATQRPSVDVITGLIKANIPTRIAFQVSSRIDSRTILDQQGAEQLLGQGDMLYLPPGSGVPIRVHGAFVDDHEVHRVVRDWKKRGKPEYVTDVTNFRDPAESGSNGEYHSDVDELYDEAVRIVLDTRRATISHIQRRLRIGYNRAARILEQMENDGLVSQMESNGLREVLVPEGSD